MNVRWTKHLQQIQEVLSLSSCCPNHLFLGLLVPVSRPGHRPVAGTCSKSKPPILGQARLPSGYYGRISTKFQPDFGNWLHLDLFGGIPTPRKNDGLGQLGWWHSQLNGNSHNSMVPNHQVTDHFHTFHIYHIHNIFLGDYQFQTTNQSVVFGLRSVRPSLWPSLSWCSPPAPSPPGTGCPQEKSLMIM